MTSLLAVFGFLAAVLYEGHSLECEHCLGFGSTSCKGSMMQCEDVDENCIQGFENNTLDGDMGLVPFKFCNSRKTMPSAICEASEHSFWSSHLQVRFVSECGQRMDELEVLPINLTTNGHKCPDCFIEGSTEECKTDKVIECVGRQTECMDVRGKASRPQLDVRSYSFKGCSTPGACHLMYYLPGSQFKFYTVEHKCEPASKM